MKFLFFEDYDGLPPRPASDTAMQVEPILPLMIQDTCKITKIPPPSLVSTINNHFCLPIKTTIASSSEFSFVLHVCLLSEIRFELTSLHYTRYSLLVVAFITYPHFRQLSTNTSSGVSLTMEALHETKKQTINRQHLR